jgi:dTDP-L-rhamnose 4-epimerase
MKKKVLVLGGAGFIGQYLVRSLLKMGCSIRVLDNFNSQVHVNDYLPSDLISNIELLRGDVRNRELMRRALTEIEVVVHLAAETGTGQSMYDIERYFSVNIQGTATLLDVLQNDVCADSVHSIIVASSRSVYGEGAYSCVNHGLVFPDQRTREIMSYGQFDPLCPFCGCGISVLPTPELAPFNPMSMYGLTKQVQEQAVLLFARTRGVNGFGLRYQNVYGPGQSLKNPYTGILSIFSTVRLKLALTFAKLVIIFE